MERRTQSRRIRDTNECDRYVLRSQELAVNSCVLYFENRNMVIYETLIVFDPCSGYLPCAAGGRAWGKGAQAAI